MGVARREKWVDEKGGGWGLGEVAKMVELEGRGGKRGRGRR